MTITKRDAEDLAEVFHRVGKSQTLYTADQIKREIAEEIARVGVKSNPRFNKKQFLNAAGFTPEEAKKGKKH